MGNKISPTRDGVTVAVDPHYILVQPASLPGENGQPKLTGYYISNLLVCMAQQVVGVKAPNLLERTTRPMTAVEVTFDKGQFLVKFTRQEDLLNGVTS
jgi:hypothetical protein